MENINLDNYIYLGSDEYAYQIFENKETGELIYL